MSRDHFGFRSTRMAILILLNALAFHSGAQEGLPEGRELARQLSELDEGQTLSRKIVFELVDRQGKSRTQETHSIRKYFGDEKRSVIFYKSPKNIEGTAFMTYDYADPAKADDQWLYLPATRKARRISASDRGDYFLGTDLTYDDMKHESDFALEDYNWKTLGIEEVDGHKCYVLEAIPVTPETAEQLGYGKVHFIVDQQNKMKRKAEFWDPNSQPLKTILCLDIKEVSGIWTIHKIVAENKQNGHKTTLTFSDVKYNEEINDQMFTEQSLIRGL
jgi:outer membrane lipoprotein-sorting protein